MIRESVAQGQSTLQVKFSVQPEPPVQLKPTVNALPQSRSPDSTTTHANEREFKEQDDFGEVDEDDWDAFQSLPANNAAECTSDLHDNITKTMPNSVCKSPPAQTADCYEEIEHQYDLPDSVASEVVDDTLKLETTIHIERNSIDEVGEETLDSEYFEVEKNEFEESSDPLYSDKERPSSNKDELEGTLDSLHSEFEKGELQESSSLYDSADKERTSPKESSSPYDSVDKETMSPNKDKLEVTVDPQHSKVEKDENEELPVTMDSEHSGVEKDEYEALAVTMDSKHSEVKMDEPEDSSNPHESRANQPFQSEDDDQQLCQNHLSSPKHYEESNGQHFEGGSELSISAEGEEVSRELYADLPSAPEYILNEISREHSQTVSRDVTETT